MKNSSKRTPDQYRERDKAALGFIGREHVALIESISQVIGGGKCLGHLVRRLADMGLVTLHARSLPGGVSYCQLTEAGCDSVGVARERSRPLAEQALNKALTVHAWCNLAPIRRYRIERQPAEELLGVRLPSNQVHCLSDEAGAMRVYRMQLLQGKVETALRALQGEVSHAKAEIAKRISQQQYGFMLLVDSESRRKHVASLLPRLGLTQVDGPIVKVDVSATVSTIAAHLRSLRKGELSQEH